MTKNLVDTLGKDTDNMTSSSDCESSDNELEERSVSDQSCSHITNSENTESVTSMTCDCEVQTILLGDVLERILILLDSGITLEELERIPAMRLQAGKDSKATLLLDATTNRDGDSCSVDVEAPLESAGNESGEVFLNRAAAVSNECIHQNNSEEEKNNLPNLSCCSNAALPIQAQVNLSCALVNVPNPIRAGKGNFKFGNSDLNGSKRLSGGANLVLLMKNLVMDVNNSIEKSWQSRPESINQDIPEEEENEAEVEMEDDPHSGDGNGLFTNQNNVNEAMHISRAQVGQWQWLCDVIPKADPGFLRFVVKRSGSSKELMDIADKFLKYPHLIETKEGRATRRKWMNKNYSSKEFLEGLADPLGYYYDNTRMVSEQYQIHVETHLQNLFPHVYKKEFDFVLRRCNHHLTSAYHVLTLIYGRLRAGDESRFVKKRVGAKKRLPTVSSMEFYNELIFLDLEDEIKAIMRNDGRDSAQECDGCLRVRPQQLGANSSGGWAPSHKENRKRLNEDEALTSSQAVGPVEPRGQLVPPAVSASEQMHMDFLMSHPELWFLYQLDSQNGSTGKSDAKRMRKG